MNSTDIKGHLILVAGAASGIGREIAKNLLSKGAVVAACDKNMEALQSFKTESSSQNLYILSLIHI